MKRFASVFDIKIIVRQQPFVIYHGYTLGLQDLNTFGFGIKNPCHPIVVRVNCTRFINSNSIRCNGNQAVSPGITTRYRHTFSTFASSAEYPLAPHNPSVYEHAFNFFQFHRFRAPYCITKMAAVLRILSRMIANFAVDCLKCTATKDRTIILNVGARQKQIGQIRDLCFRWRCNAITVRRKRQLRLNPEDEHFSPNECIHPQLCLIFDGDRGLYLSMTNESATRPPCKLNSSFR